MRSGVKLMAIAAAAGLALDLWSKHAAFVAVPTPYDRLPVIDGFFYLAHVRNPGMAWSLFQGVDRGVWVVVRSALSAALLWLYATTTRRGAPWWAHLAFGMLFGGALGNLFDNVFAEDGRVRDFLLFKFGERSFPVFNVADSLISVGAPLLFIHLSRHDREQASRKGGSAGSAGRPVEPRPETPSQEQAP